MNQTAARRPFYLSLLVFAVWLAIMLGGSIYTQRVEQRSILDILPNRLSPVLLAAVIWLLAATAVLRWRRPAGLVRPKNWREMQLLWLPGILILGYLSMIFVAYLLDPALFAELKPGYLVANLLLVGISEELMFRGVLFHGADAAFGWRRAVWFSALLFGALHLGNGYFTGHWGYAALQAVNATLIGLWLAALRLRMSSLYPAIGVHWLWNISPLALLITTQRDQGAAAAAAGSPGVLATVLIGLACLTPIWVAFTFYNLWLLAGYQRRFAPDPRASVTGGEESD